MEINYLLLLPVTVVCAWALAFYKNGRVKDLHDRLFFMFAGCSVLTYYIVIHSLVEGTDSYHFLLMDNIESLLGLSICPLLFLYIRSVVRDAKWHRWYLWLFLPAVVITALGTALSFIVGWDRILEVRIDGYHPFIPTKDNMAEQLYYVVNIRLFDITIEVMAVVMIGLCVYYIIRYKRKAENYFANIEDASIGRIHNFFACTTLNMTILFLLTFFILNIVGSNTAFLLTISLTVSLLFWLTAKNAYGIVVVKENLDIIDSLPETFNEEESQPAIVNDEIKGKLEYWIDSQEKHFCREGITLAEVAKETNISPRALSVYINKNKGMNFRRWINTLRIEEAKRMMANNPEEKITYIAMLCGFADLASFSKVFHTIEGCSPMEYRVSKVVNVFS